MRRYRTLRLHVSENGAHPAVCWQVPHTARRADCSANYQEKAYMEISSEFVQQFFSHKHRWVVPVGFVLFTLCALVIATDESMLAPFVLIS